MDHKSFKCNTAFITSNMIFSSLRIDVCDKSGSKEIDKSIPGIMHAFYDPFIESSITTITRTLFLPYIIIFWGYFISDVPDDCVVLALVGK